MINKIYICSTNLSGKAYLLSLLDGHIDNGIYPFHKFGFSNQIKKFYSFLSRKQYPVYKGFFNTNKNFIIPIINSDNKKIYNISFGEILFYIIKEFDSMPFLLQSHFTKTFSSYSGDKKKMLSNFEFDFNKFTDLFFQSFNLSKPKYYTLEDIDNFLYKSFILSLGNYKVDKKNQSKKNIVLYGANDSQQIDNLFNYYKNFKILFIKRDPLAISYSNSKRILSLNDKNPSANSIFRLMLSSSKNQKRNIDKFNKLISNYQHFGDKIKIIDFEDLFLKTKEVMSDIAKFLDIKFDDILIRPTSFGDDCISNSIVDNPYKSLNGRALSRLENIYHDKKRKSFIDTLYFLGDKILIAILNNRLLHKVIVTLRGKKK